MDNFKKKYNLYIYNDYEQSNNKIKKKIILELNRITLTPIVE